MSFFFLYERIKVHQTTFWATTKNCLCNTRSFQPTSILSDFKKGANFSYCYIIISVQCRHSNFYDDVTQWTFPCFRGVGVQPDVRRCGLSARSRVRLSAFWRGIFPFFRFQIQIRLIVFVYYLLPCIPIITLVNCSFHFMKERATHYASPYPVFKNDYHWHLDQKKNQTRNTDDAPLSILHPFNTHKNYTLS